MKNFIDYVKQNLINELSRAILFVGSRVTGTHHKTSDLDIVIISKSQDRPITNEKREVEGVILDIWGYDIDYLKSQFYSKPTNLNEVGNISLILSFLREGKLIYNIDKEIEEMITKSKQWHWDQSVIEFTNFNSTIPDTQYLKNAYEENIKLLGLIRERLKQDFPISHRLKDFKDELLIVEDKYVKEIFNLISLVYKETGITREWTEMSDAKKALSRGELNIVIASLRDVLKFLLRIVMKNPPEIILDPSIWKLVEDFDLPINLTNSIKQIYSIYPTIIDSS